MVEMVIVEDGREVARTEGKFVMAVNVTEDGRYQFVSGGKCSSHESLFGAGVLSKSIIENLIELSKMEEEAAKVEEKPKKKPRKKKAETNAEA